MNTTHSSKKRYQMLGLLSALVGGAVLLQYIDKPMVLKPQSPPIAVYTPDWGVASTMVSLGYPPLATGDSESYRLWIDTPSLPHSVYNVGTRSQPNVELLAQLEPDLIIDTPTYQNNRAAYPNDIPQVQVDFTKPIQHSLDAPPKWSDYADIIYQIADAIEQPELAQPYIDSSEARIKQAGANIRAKLGDNRPILVSNFWDMRQLSVYNNNSTIKLTADMMGLDLLSIGEPTKWGSSYVYPSALYNLPADTCLIVIGPIPEMTKTDSVNSSIWQQSPFFGPDACLYKIAPVWARSGIESMTNFASNLEAAVMNEDDSKPANKTQNTNAVINDLSYAYVQKQKDSH